MIGGALVAALTVLFAGWLWFPKQFGREAARWHSKFLRGWREEKERMI